MPKVTCSPSSVLVAGCTAVDIMAQTVDQIPDKGSSALFDAYEIHLGGNAANVAVDLAKLGTEVGLCSKVGKDALGEFCIMNMREAGVKTEGILHSSARRTACSLVLVPSDGNRRILHSPGATMEFDDQNVSDVLLQNCQYLLVAGFFCLPHMDGDSLKRLFQRAKSFGVTTLLDCSVNHRIKDWWEYLEPAVPYLDILFPSEEEARTITGQSNPRAMTDFFRAKKISIAGVKLGEKGCALSFGKDYAELPAYQVKVVDTCGAGDAFMAGFISALQHGKSPKEAAQFGNAAGAMCIQQLGATAGVVDAKKVFEFQQRTPTY